MYFVDNGSAVPVMPQVKPVSSATPQFFTEGGNGTPPTYPGPDWFNIVQTELLNLLKEAGIDPDKANHAQLLAAMKKLFLTRSNPFADIKADGPAAVAAALSNLGLGERLNNKLDKTGGILTGSLVVPELHAQNAIYIGDNDSGFHANGDGSVALWIDGKQVGYFTKNEFKHFGKIISMSGLAADDGNTQFQQDGDIKGKKWNGLLSTFMESRYGKKNTTGEGWWKCGDTGLMIQWGEVSSPNKVWFPTSFSWRCFSITFGQKNTAGWMTSPMADNIDKAGFSFYNNGRSQNDVNNQNVEDKVFYMAIGV